MSRIAGARLGSFESLGIAASLLMVLLVGHGAVAQPLAIDEDFEDFALGRGDGQFGWISDSAGGFEIVDTGVPRFGARTASFVRTGDFPNDIIGSPIFPGCLDCTLYADVLVDRADASIKVETYDVRGGIQNTLAWFRDEGEVLAFQMDDNGQFLGVWHETTGRWLPNEIMRLGIEVRSNGELNVFLDGELIFQGDDMSADWPFGFPDTGIGRFLVNGGGDAPVGTTILVDNISASPLPPVGSKLTGSCPGNVTLELTEGTPGGEVFVLSSALKGSERVPGGACAGVLTDLADLDTRRRETFGPSGALELTLSLPPDACGRFVQAIDVESCRSSALVSVP